jgi:signal transduction histidine kinase
MLLLALAVAEIVRAERLARTAAQAEALDASARLTDNLRHSEARLAQAVQDRTRALEDLLRNQQRVQADQRQMLSLAAHEFRTPAAIIKSSLDSLRWLQPQIPPEVQKRLDNIAQATHRLQRLAQDLIHDERLNQQGIAPQLRPLALGTLLQAWLEDRPVALHIANAPPTLMGDEALLGIAVQNLVDNALRHHPASGPPVQVTLDQISGPSGPLARLRVADRGPGVPDADRELVFERHFSTQPSQHGAGLGLSIVRRVAQAHQGQVQLAADHQPPGAVFELLLPLQA